MRPVFASMAIALAAAAPAAAQQAWTDYRSAEHGFAVSFPAAPKPKPNAGERAPFEIQAAAGNKIYDITVIEPAGGGPEKSDTAFLGRLIAAYAKGSASTLRSQNPTTVAGRPALEAVTEDPAHDRYHLVDVFAAGGRVYIVGSMGPKGHEASADAKRFRNSFKLIAR
jgi:hypothetical protein